MLVYLMSIESPEERSTFESIYDAYKGVLFNVAMAYLKSEFDAEDAVHQTFMYAAENMYKFSKGVCPGTMSYLVKTVRCRSIDIIRARHRCPPIDFYDKRLDPDQVSFGLSPLAACIAKLPERYRDALILRISHGFEFHEIARLMNITEANARKIVTRARKKLEAICKEEGVL